MKRGHNNFSHIHEWWFEKVLALIRWGFMYDFGWKVHVQIKHGIEHSFESDESGHAKAKCVDMTDHKETHGIGHPNRCGLCGIEFKANDQLDIHVHTKHGSGHPICCSLCGTKFTNKNQLDIHVKTKQGTRHPFHWGLCGTKFTDKKKLDIHLQIHGSEPPIFCGLCATKFTDKNQLEYIFKHMGANTHFVVVCVLQNLQTRTRYIYTYILNMGSDNLLKAM